MIQEITEASACRCLLASERTSASLCVNERSNRRVIFCAPQLMKRTRIIAPKIAMTICKPLSSSQRPIGLDQKEFQRSASRSPPALNSAALIIAPVAPPDPRLDESVDVPVEHRRGIAHLVLGAKILDHLVRLQHIGAHLRAP
ncbi:Uncharacterised protein [Mycobacteroides abscessus subsp. abscessus]|nr:Uncharacterised protein [Mycobacteroides abscessus subsp. abscessus]